VVTFQRPSRVLVLSTISLAAMLLTAVSSTLGDAARPTAAPQPIAQDDPKPATVPAAAAPATPAPATPAPAVNARPAAAPAPTPQEAPKATGTQDAAKPATPLVKEHSPQDKPGGLVRDPNKPLDDKLVTLGFKEESVASLIPFIQEWTGKAVIVPLSKIQNTKITIVNDKPLPKNEALNLVFQALKVSGLGVVENDTVITIDTLTEIAKISHWIVLDASQDVMNLSEEGNFVIKAFRLKHSKAQDVADRIQESSWPPDVSIAVDVNSNQIVLSSDVGLAKRVQLLINNLDVPPHVVLETRNYRIQFQDANLIADNIRDLFEGVSGGGGRAPRASANQRQGRNPGQPGQPQVGSPQVGTSEQLVVTVVPALNTITVRAEPPILAEIDRLMTTAWDLPPNKFGSPFRTYTLKFTDPLKVQATLQALLEGGGSGGAGRTGGNRNNRAAFVPGGAGGGDGGAQAAVANVFRIEAYPDSSQLVVISKTPENFPWLDEMVNALDQPLQVGLPTNVPLKYASAFKIAEIINVLLAEDGSGTGISQPAEGLTGIDFNAAGGEGATGGTTGGTDRAGATGGGAAGANGAVQFPWQAGRGGQNGTEVSPVSAAIGKARVVPNATQNSLLVLAPPQIQDSILKMIEDLDRPGRQVMVTAVLAEVSLGDGFSWGLRTGNNLTTLNGNDNSVGGSIDTTLSKGNGDAAGANFASPWFDVSTLDITSNVGFLLQALDAKNDVRILQEPRVFTSDNEEAKFFSGQDITFQTGQTTGSGTGGGTTSSFETKAVGIGLNVRPRITRELNVNMDIELLLSNLNLSVQQFNNNPVVDRRQTNTRITVKNGQTIVISGIRKEDETNIKRGLPLLGDIPILGDAIFSSTEKKKNVSELVIFVTPLVVDNPDANDTNFNAGERGRLEDLRTPLGRRDAPDGERGFFENLRSVDITDGAAKGGPSSAPAVPAPAPSPSPAPNTTAAAPSTKPAEPPVEIPK
jgi:type II secretion system protein D